MPGCRKAAQNQQHSRQENATTSPPPESINSNQQVPDKSAAEREQERRHREAVSEARFILCSDEDCGWFPYGMWKLFPERGVALILLWHTFNLKSVGDHNCHHFCFSRCLDNSTWTCRAT
jgi:hypothetical protein